MNGQILDFDSYRAKCQNCGHYVDEHIVEVEDELDSNGHVCQRVMEIKNGRVYYRCGCILEEHL